MMPSCLTIIDSSTLGEPEQRFVLKLDRAIMTVRDLIRARVYQEVEAFNRQSTWIFKGLVQPIGTQATRQGYPLESSRPLDAAAQFEKAIAAFQHNGFVILVNDEQVMNLDEAITLVSEPSVTFIKLIPLVGG